VTIVDIGVASEFDPSIKGLIRRKIAPGTRNLAKGPAMSRAEAEKALAEGMDVLAQVAANGLDLVATGDMGIGNTTPSSAIVTVLTGLPVASVTGRGTGVTMPGWRTRFRSSNRPSP